MFGREDPTGLGEGLSPHRRKIHLGKFNSVTRDACESPCDSSDGLIGILCYREIRASTVSKSQTECQSPNNRLTALAGNEKLPLRRVTANSLVALR